MTITAAGYIAVQEGYAIFGTGRNAPEAVLASAEWLDSGSSSDELTTIPATQSLIDLVERDGGQVVYGMVNGIACTEDEESSGNAA